MPGPRALGTRLVRPRGPGQCSKSFRCPQTEGGPHGGDDAIDVGLAAAAHELDRCPSARSLVAAGG